MECRPQFVAGVKALLKFFDEKIPHALEKTQINPFHGKSCNIYKGDVRKRRPWVFLDQVAEGRCGPIGFPGSLHSWDVHVLAWIDQNEKAFH